MYYPNCPSSKEGGKFALAETGISFTLTAHLVRVLFIPGTQNGNFAWKIWVSSTYDSTSWHELWDTPSMILWNLGLQEQTKTQTKWALDDYNWSLILVYHTIF